MTRRRREMTDIIAAAGIVLLVIYLFGIAVGMIVTACVSFHHDPLKGRAPDSTCAGTRRLVGVGMRDARSGQSADHPETQHEPGRRP
jgi:hypothetical protein